MMNSLKAADRLASAILFACRHHGDDTRDDGVTLYAVHPLRVHEHLRRIGREMDEDVLIAALLHDTIEDTSATFDDIAARFGEPVASLVAELTNDNRLPEPLRRARMLEHVPSLSARAKRIKLADRLDNTLDLVRGIGTDEKRRRYVGESEIILQGCAGACPPLEQALAQAIEQLRHSVTDRLQPVS